MVNQFRGPLLEDIIEQLHKKDLINLRIIGLSAFIENQKAFLKWFPIQTQTLTYYQYPVELRKGIVRDGTFKYITSNKKNTHICRKEIFFKSKSVRDNCFKDYLLETLKYLINQGEPTLIFFATCAETRHWAKWLASHLKSPTASPSSAPKDLAKMEETLSRNELLKPLEKGIAFYNQDLSWEERNLLETYLKKGEISNLEILYLLSQTPDGKELPIPFYHSSINDYKKERYKCEQEEIHAERILHLIFQQNEQDKKLYQEKILLKNCKEDEVFSLEENLSFKKTLLLYDWINGVKSVKTIEQEYNLFRGAIYRLGGGFSWLADSLAAIAENTGWKKKRKEDLNQIKLLSNRLILSSFPSKNYKPKTKNFSPEPSSSPLQPETRNPKPVTILEIDQHRPDRIIFMGEKIKVTAKEFSLIHLLAQNRGKILTHNDFLDTIWKESEDATYIQITYHLYKIRRDILKIIGNNKKNKEKVKDILKVISRRGIMMNLEEDKLKIS